MSTLDAAAGGPADLDRLAHHGDRETFAGAVDFAVNVRRAAPPPWLREQLVAAVDRLGAYPARAEQEAVTAQIAAHHGVPAEAVMLLAGASEGFTLIAAELAAAELAATATLDLAPRPALVLHPSYTEPEAALRRAGMPVRRLLLPAPFGLAPAIGSPLLDDVRCVILGNPTNPTGVLHDGGDVAALGAPGRVLVVDEAFMDLAVVPGQEMQGGGAAAETEGGGTAAEPEGGGTAAEPQSLAGRIESGRIVLRSLTKTWALAGLRLGYAVGDPDLLARLEARRPPWAVGTLQLAAAAAVFSARGQAELRAERQQMAAERAAMVTSLEAVGIELATASAAPFLLARIPAGCDPAGFRGRLAAAGIAVRRCDTFPGLDWDTSGGATAVADRSARDGGEAGRHHLRLAVRGAEQVERLIQAWRDAAPGAT